MIFMDNLAEIILLLGVAVAIMIAFQRLHGMPICLSSGPVASRF